MTEKDKTIDPHKVVTVVKRNWWLIGPILKIIFNWGYPKIKKLFTKKKDNE